MSWDVLLKGEHRCRGMRALMLAALMATAASARGGGVILLNEIMFNPANDAQDLEFVELYNTLSFGMDISGWKIDGGIEFTFPVNTTIPSEGFLVIAKSPSALEAAAGINGVLGPYSGQLANGGESVRLENNSGRVMDEMDYGDGGRWPVAPAGSGASLAKIDPFTASAPAVNWHPGRVGGTPGWGNFTNGAPVPPDLVLNEIAGVTNTSWWIELRNNSSATLDPAGYVLSIAGDPTRQYPLPGSSVPAGGFLLLTAAQLGFAPVDEEPIFLYRPGMGSVADARVAKRSLRGRLAEQWLIPSVPTPGATNAFALNTDIVIDEIMYHHQATNDGVTFIESNEEWIELLNRGAGTVDLSGWKFEDGISHTFPAGTMLASGAFLVVSNFSGNLSDAGERLLLVDASGNPADEVQYFDGGRWPERADGGGSSLELRDPFADNSRPEAWAASDEGARTGWQTCSHQVVANASLAAGPDSQWRDFVVGLLDSGEVLLDDISVIEDPGGANTQLISTGGFENGIGDWRIIGTHRHSEVIVDPDNPANQVLRLVATGATDHMHNHAEITLANGQSVENGKTYLISFRAKWIGGSRLLNTRLYFNRAPKTYVLQVPMHNGTPGAQNSAHAVNIGPTFERMQHEPAVPDAGAPVNVSATVADPQGVASVLVRYSVNGAAWQQLVMTNTGYGGFAATLPAQPASSLVQFYVEARDGLGAVATFPAGGPGSGALYQVNDGQSDPRLHNFRIIMTQANAGWMDSDTNYMSNDPIPATVIFRDRDIYYDVGVRFKGSLFGRHAEAKAGFRVGFNADQPFHGVLDNVSVDRSALPDVSRMPEMLIHLAMNRCGGVMTKYSDWIKVIVPISGHSNPAQLQLGHYSDVFLDGQFENGGEGGLFEFEYIYYPNSTNAEGYKRFDGGSADIRPPMQDYGPDKESYRHSFPIKNNRARDDYSGLINLAKVMGMSGAAFNSQVDAVADVDQWLRYFAHGVVSGYNDNFARGSQHNAYFYRRPSDGRFLYFTHDLDHTQSTPALVSGNTYLQKMIAANPGWERLYYSHMRDVLNTAWNTAYMQDYTDQFSTLMPSASGNFATFLSRIGSYHNSLSSALASSVAPAYPFALTSGPQTVNTLTATVTGNAWLDVYEIRLAGQNVPLPLTWTATGSGATRTYSWSATAPLDPGTNVLTFLAYDYRGNLVGSNTVSIITTVIGNPVQDQLRVTELMANPAGGSDYEFIELCNTGDQALNLAGVRFSEGITFDFSAAGFTNLNPGEHCVVVANAAAFASRYGTPGILVAGEYSGKLANEGETIELQGALNEELLRFSYGSGRGWPPAAEGAGHALVPLDSAVAGQRAGSLYHGANWRAGNAIHGSPGQPEPAVVPALQLNEILAHTDYSNPAYPEYDSNDQIELVSLSNTNLVLGANWYLSDDATQLDKWAIPAATSIAPHGHVTFDEVTGFHSPITNGFGLDKAGEQVFLSHLPSSGPRRVVDAVRFKGQENGVSLGRYGDGGAFWHALSPTIDSINAKPDLRPVISEFMFHPPDNPTNNTRDEFLEIHNPTGAPVELWNAAGAWRIDGGVGYSFPSNTTLAAGESLVLVTFDPGNSAALAGFLATYGLTNGEVAILGPMSDQLDNRGERIALERPQAGDLAGDPVSWVIVDEVLYFHQSPWPTGADGTGRSLQRKHTRWSGNDPNSWYASFTPSPGKVAETYGGRGVPDWWLAERIPGATNSFTLAAISDPDGDGLATEEEYVAGTDPLLVESCLRLIAGPDEIRFQTAEAGYEYNGLERRYSLKVSTSLNPGVFNPVAGFGDVPADGGMRVLPIPASGSDAGFYQLEAHLQ